MYTLLQLSDLHFGKDHFFTEKSVDPNLAESIKIVLDESQMKIDHVVFSGDFFSHDQANDIDLAKNGIIEIRDKLKISKGDVSFVPGNHDLTWNKQYIKKPFHFYDELLDKIGAKGFKKQNLPVVLWLNKEFVKNKNTVRPIFLALLDSCKVESEILAGIGAIGINQLTELNNQLKLNITDWKNTTKLNFGEYTLIVALHHHLLPVHAVESIPEIEYNNRVENNDWAWHGVSYQAYKARSSHTLDAVDILNQLAKLDTALVIHGHQHKSAIVSYQNKLESLPMLTIAAAGSCASKEPSTREFFVYQIDEHEIKINRFVQSGSARRFEFKKSEVNPIRIHLPHISRVSLEYCVEEAKQQHTESNHEELSNSQDFSDLNLLLLSVASCKDSRELVRDFFTNHESIKNSQPRLQGMYDLLGHWDLLIRFRLNQTDGFDEAKKKKLRDILVLENHQMTVKGVFSDGIHINVKKEAKNFGDLLKKNFSKYTSLTRNIFAEEQDYSERRCQRGFLFISLPSEEEKRRIMIRDLANLLDDEPKFKQIIEGVYEGNYLQEISDENSQGDKKTEEKFAVVIEVFMTCAQSLYLNHLNKKIEDKLAEHKLQKYTMFCYGYDEKELLNSKATE